VEIVIDDRGIVEFGFLISRSWACFARNPYRTSRRIDIAGLDQNDLNGILDVFDVDDGSFAIFGLKFAVTREPKAQSHHR
jgi:hypothetical protein